MLEDEAKLLTVDLIMDQAVLLILIVFGGTVVGLVLTADNEPPPPMKVEKEERLHYVDKIPGHDTYNITIIKNPDRLS